MDTADVQCEDILAYDEVTENLAVQAQKLADLPTGTPGALIDPWVMGQPDDLVQIWNWVVADDEYGYSSPSAWGFDEDEECPCEDDDYDLEGPCTTSAGWSQVGRLASGKTGWDLDRYGLGYAGPEGTFLSLAHGWDGGDDKGELRRHLGHSGQFDVGLNGTWILDGWGLAGTGRMYLMVSEVEGFPNGDADVAYDFYWSDGCAEPAGILRVMGADEVAVWFDGDVVCDGCGALFVDGSELGEVCFPSFASPDETGVSDTAAATDVDAAAEPIACACGGVGPTSLPVALAAAVGFLTRRRILAPA